MKKKYIDIEKIEKYYRIESDGMIFSLRKQRYLLPSFNSARYLFVNLTTDDGSSLYSVHRLVATKYLGHCPDNLEVSHKDGCKTNNDYRNLEYLTHAKNILKSYQEHSRVFQEYVREPISDETKRLMSNAKKKSIIYSLNGVDTIYSSIEEAREKLKTYRKRIYLCIKNGVIFNGGFLTYNKF